MKKENNNSKKVLSPIVLSHRTIRFETKISKPHGGCN